MGAALPTAVVFGLCRSRYVQTQRVGRGEQLRLGEPFDVDVDFAALATAIRLPRPR